MLSTKEEREIIKGLNGLYIGMLDNDEIEILNKCIMDNFAKRDYDHVGGLLGMAKIKVICESIE